METTYAIPAIPDWLIEEQDTAQRTCKEMMELMEKQYEIAFEHVLIQMAGGTKMKDAVNEYHTDIDPDKFRVWIWADKKRKRRYYDAKEIGAEAIEEETIDIADAKNDTLEDVQRSKLRVDTRLKIIGHRDRKRFGADPDIVSGGTGPINIVIAGVTSPYEQIPNGTVIDHE